MDDRGTVAAWLRIISVRSLFCRGFSAGWPRNRPRYWRQRMRFFSGVCQARGYVALSKVQCSWTNARMGCRM
ncbi:hypothetical protein BABINDRAFT_99884 [Babjeviella inositovora NRRL Y-12698]|uniref:Uncharacterized protein n=1 Tax=Babjeviella inositovora NRRL Y-12698 TaxID=984486 RepID=A0A1E3QI55_9ASCO|nr:uncharacterized protein BABINDRAFT_99884 [Babjeviella inositovora NRRL Y-12698]ODQ77288.1 hypothetical protein BABINDRAFT_99884 [Babjeviella inositovora NRRL Y-12698]